MTRFPTTKTCIVGSTTFPRMRPSTMGTFFYNSWWVLIGILLEGIMRWFSFPRLVKLHCLTFILFQRSFDSCTFLEVFFYSFSKCNQSLVVFNLRSSQTLSDFEF
ncbi:hypothetical protein ACJW30_08G064900 [Castanea mollissima]